MFGCELFESQLFMPDTIKKKKKKGSDSDRTLRRFWLRPLLQGWDRGATSQLGHGVFQDIGGTVGGSFPEAVKTEQQLAI